MGDRDASALKDVTGDVFRSTDYVYNFTSVNTRKSASDQRVFLEMLQNERNRIDDMRTETEESQIQAEFRQKKEKQEAEAALKTSKKRARRLKKKQMKGKKKSKGAAASNPAEPLKGGDLAKEGPKNTEEQAETDS
ncbi:protein of unknown function DUF1168 [Kipferlia bialata]|uniref:Uncharacterized protein n=1 Tax=Kipferlia bialata TaxID=797122 RepID=A0A9K3GE64_9EUKA|nr:protein of unknown function DUF1168 [Kipferlia bialata]|eukprot:g20.t1